MKLVFLGAPGVGKGTQAALICERHRFRHISTGDLLREAVWKKTPLGLAAQEAMDRGDLVGDGVILGLIEATLGDVKEDGFILDGFPRTRAQANGLDRLLEKRGERLDGVLLLTADDEEIFERLTGRGRTDDDPETIRHRLSVYAEKTTPLVGYYEEKGILVRSDGVGPIPDVLERIESALKLEPREGKSWSS